MSEPNSTVGSGPAMPDLQGLRVMGACDNYTPESSGGAEKAAHEIYLRWGAAGADVRVVSVPHGPVYVDPGVTVAPARGVDLSRFVGGYVALSPDSFRVATRVWRDFRPEVLHANTIHYNACIAAARIAARSGLPFVLTAQLGSTKEMPLFTRLSGGAYDRTVGRYIVRRATRILAVSESVADHMASIGADPSRIRVVENGVDHERFACPDLAEGDDPLVLSVGRIVDNKGPHVLVEAAKILAQQGKIVNIGFLGDGPMRAKLEAEVAAAGLQGSVVFHGQVRDVERWLARAAIVVRPSFTEGLPLAVLEAMSAGRCNIVSDIRPNLELIDHDVNGLVFRAGDAADLAAKIWEAVDDPARRVRLAAAGRLASRARSWDRMAAETASEFTSVSRTGQRPS